MSPSKDLYPTDAPIPLLETVAAPTDCIGYTHAHRCDPATIPPMRRHHRINASAPIVAARKLLPSSFTARDVMVDATFIDTRVGQPETTNRETTDSGIAIDATVVDTRAGRSETMKRQPVERDIAFDATFVDT